VLITCCPVVDMHVCMGRCVVLRSKLETHLCGKDDIRSTNNLEGLIVTSGSMVDVCDVGYILKLETLLQRCDLNCRRCFDGPSSISTSTWTHIRVDSGSLYAASQAEEVLLSLKVSGAGIHHMAPSSISWLPQ
jgi:hypothetical protein